jgi:hypothetical protein
VDFRTPYAGLAQNILYAIAKDPERFAGAKGIKFYDHGAEGPSGHEGGGEFIADESREATRRDTIFTAVFENLVETEPNKSFDVQLLLFIHNSDRAKDPYYFRRLQVKMDWGFPKEQLNQRVRIVSVTEEIPLGAAAFVMKTDIFERKMILEDSKHRIWLVFPVNAAALDIRTEPTMDGKVTTLTGEWPNATLKSPKLTGEDQVDSFLNTRRRSWPYYFLGRPFFALYNGAKTIQTPATDYIAVYGMFRNREFSTLGGIRLRDQDLYVLDAILNEGAAKEMSAQVVNHLDGYQTLQPALPAQNENYMAVLYSTKPVSPGISCRSPFQEVFLNFNGGLHTTFGMDCATRLSPVKSNVEGVLRFAQDKTGEAPKTPVKEKPATL